MSPSQRSVLGPDRSPETLFQPVDRAEIAYRRVGAGDPLLLVHGWPLHGQTFRAMLPALAEHFTCYVVDLPGAGESVWSERTDFGFRAQAECLRVFADRLGLRSYSILAHDAGATIARALSILDPARVKKLVAIGTEIPNHRPPWIEIFQRLSYLPGADFIFRRNLQSDGFLRSARGFGGCFSDHALLEGEFHSLFIDPLIHSATLRAGQRQRLRGIDWTLVDSLAEGHRQIRCPVLLVWGEDDPVFPVARAREMVGQLSDCRGLEVIAKAKLFVHEERPEAVARAALAFLRA